ncbi:heavy metal response regulator transcription factor [Crenobacter luteus]|uniref:Two-component system response regulator n=1 Tax=Crenobacter luteus TaxID=1452487 RepID=A0A161RAY6_9NEIS|nr:heavy metal response regulator transcription factor [Crenobacter luteus]KZE34218.1 two-component system response regulator [Crenobacter luteus]
MWILIVEDEERAAAYLKQGLAEAGFKVDVAHDGVEGEYLALEHAYDLVILDVMLPGKTGWQVLESLRRSKQVPVLFLTARDRVEDRVRGLEAGADDYLVKPFAFSELLARVRTLLRRRPVSEPDVLKVGDLELDLARHKAWRDGVRIALTAKEMSLLALFMRRQGEVLSRTLIAEQIWDIHFDTDTNAVEVAIRRLRAKIDDPFETKLIHTLRGVGYVLEAGRVE